MAPRTTSSDSEGTLQANQKISKPMDTSRSGSPDVDRSHDQQREETQGEKNDNNADKEKNADAPPVPVGFWDKSLNQVRKHVFIHWAKTTLILMCFIMAVLSLYWSVLFNVEENLEALKVAIVSFDGQFAPYAGTTPLVGRAAGEVAMKLAQQPTGTLGWMVRTPDDYDNDPFAVRQAVYDEHIYAAVIISNNATALLQQAVEQGNANYDPTGAAQVITNQARDENVHANYILPMLSEYQTSVQALFGPEWVSRVLSNSSLDATTYTRAPQALSPAIGFTQIDLRPFGPPQAEPAVSIGLIYLIILSFFSFSFFLPIHTKFIMPQGHPPLHFYQLILWRLIATTIAYFFMSLAYSLVSLAFQIPFSNNFPHSDVEPAVNPDAYGKKTFVVYWMLNWVGMYTLGLASENVTMFIGQPWTGLWLIFWVITNVSTSFYNINLAPRFFYWGWAWPLQQIVTASRTLLFDTHSRIGLNFGILFCWAAVNTAVFPLACLFMRWKTTKQTNAERARHIHYLWDG